MGAALDYRKIIIKLTRELPDRKLKELVDFAQFLKAKEEGFSYKQVEDSAEYVRQLRMKASKKAVSGKRFIEELTEWQRSNC